MSPISIAGREIGSDFPPYIVAEMSANHNGSLERALQIIKAAHDAGADAVKLQTYKPETMTLDVDHPRFRVKGSNPWDGEHLYDLYQKAMTPWEWHEQLFSYGKSLGIAIFSSPFDASAVDLLESLEAPAYKIASFELVDHDLIRRCAVTGKPVIMSTGMASLVEIAEAVQVAREADVRGLLLLKCTSAYPAPPEAINLRTIPHLAAAFDVVAGLSDHTMGTGVSVAATALGAALIEKHFTLSRADGGVDASFSLEPDELLRLVSETKIAHLALGQVSYLQGEMESSFRRYRRSLFFVRDLQAGASVTDQDIQSLRPGDGLPPKYKRAIVGRSLSHSVTRGTPVSWDCFA
ncbi:MAG: pseudaminic acid synthase [Planctomycetota bacterium]|nr:pseudaminic acid synthase [Anaerolineae bacterium]GIK54232.1 MAG: pseudaminic acid synthase [Planctomycetota bacterium]